MTRDHLLGWAPAAQLIADRMPAPVRPSPVRLVPVTERVGVADVDPLKAAGLKKRAKEAEQAAFEVWLARVRPDGNVESVQQQWEDSSDYADFLEAQEKPVAAPAAALGDGWIEWGGGECPVPEFTHIEIKFRCESKATDSRKPQNLRWSHATHTAYSAKFDIVAYRLLPKGGEQ